MLVYDKAYIAVYSQAKLLDPLKRTVAGDTGTAGSNKQLDIIHNKLQSVVCTFLKTVYGLPASTSHVSLLLEDGVLPVHVDVLARVSGLLTACVCTLQEGKV